LKESYEIGVHERGSLESKQPFSLEGKRLDLRNTHLFLLFRTLFG